MRRRPAGVRRTILMEWMIISSQKNFESYTEFPLAIMVRPACTPGFLGNGVCPYIEKSNLANLDRVQGFLLLCFLTHPVS